MSIRTASQSKLSTSVYNKTKASFNGSGLFDRSSGSYVNFGNQTGLKLGSSDFTVESWIKRTTTTSYMGVAGDYEGSSGSFCWFFNADGASPAWYVGGAFVLSASATVAINTWTHVAFVRSSGTLTCFINGTSAGSTSHTNNYTNSNPFILGNARTTNTTADWYGGYLSNFRITKSAVYTSSFTPTKKLTRLTDTTLLTVQNSDVIKDNGPNSYTFTTVGSVSASNDYPT